MARQQPIVLCLIVLSAFAAPALAQDREVRLSPGRINDLWQMHWPRYANRYIVMGEHDYAACYKYERSYPSSRRVSQGKVKESTRRTRKERSRLGSANLVRRTTTFTSDADAKAYARALPATAVGEYGYIQGCTITEVLGPNEMLVRDIMLVDPEIIPESKERGKVNRRYEKRAELVELQECRNFKTYLKLTGFDARGIEPDFFWTGDDRRRHKDGVQIAIVRREQSSKTSKKRTRRPSRRGRREVLVAVPAERLRTEKLTEDQFAEMLDQRGFDKERFVRLVLEQHRKRAENAEVWVLRILEETAPPPPEGTPESEEETIEPEDVKEKEPVITTD